MIPGTKMIIPNEIPNDMIFLICSTIIYNLLFSKISLKLMRSIGNIYFTSKYIYFFLTPHLYLVSFNQVQVYIPKQSFTSLHRQNVCLSEASSQCTQEHVDESRIGRLFFKSLKDILMDKQTSVRCIGMSKIHNSISHYKST